MITDITSIKIGSVWNEGRGATFKDQITDSPDLGAEILLKSPVKADLMLVRMKEGVTVILTNLSTSAEFICSRCLDKFTQQINVEQVESHFHESLPERDFDPMENFLITMKDMSIDLTEPLRQEIILHFPMIPVCSERCKGLCPSCSVNLNHHRHKKDCHFQEDQKEAQSISDTHKPFANLKELLK